MTVTLQVPTFSPLIVEPRALQYFAEEANTFIDTVEPFNTVNFACTAKDFAVLLVERDNCVIDATLVCINVVKFVEAPPLTTVVVVPPVGGTVVVAEVDDGFVVVELTAAL